jgi:tetratricopeptide (TPR) repeat protein
MPIRPKRLCTSIAMAAAAALLEASPNPPPAEAMNSASWWIATYSLMDASDPLVPRSEDVFRRVAAAADKRSNRLPKLVLLRRPERPQAIALPDGTIAVTRAAIQLCYRGGRDRTGDARLAFVLGHELSHLASDDFWQRAPFASGRAADGGRLEPGRTLGARVDQDKELSADAHGIIYATLAGYDPAALFARGSFIAEWVSQLSVAGYEVAGPLDATQRVELLRTQVASVAEELDVFHFGVRLLQLGRHADALVLLERFRTRFPGREVLNNIGLAQLQLALRFLATCDTSQYLRFKLPFIVDPQTLATTTSLLPLVPQVRSPGQPSLDCSTSARFQTPWSEALRSFRLAKEKDPSYAPAYQNLATALLISGNGTEALNEANSALKLDPGSSTAKLQRALALYLMGNENNLDETVGAAIKSLRQLQAADAGSADAVYDLARVLTERGRPAAASEAWRRFLSLEPSGGYATEARRWLPDDDTPPISDPRPADPRKLPPSPLPLGSNTRTASTTQTTLRSFCEGSFRGSILQRKGLRALAIDDIIEVVEVQTETSVAPIEVYGPPQRIESGPRGDLYFYPGLMVEWSAGRTRTEVFFQVTSQKSARR